MLMARLTSIAAMSRPLADLPLPARLRSAIPVLGGCLLIGSLLSGCASDTDTAGSQTTPASSGTSAPAASTASDSPATASSPAGDAASAIPGATPVAPAELVALISDRTFSGIYEGEEYQEYYQSDGTIRGTEAGEKYTGTWALRGDQLCFYYPDSSAEPTESGSASPAGEESCYTAAIDGSTVYWFGGGEPSKTTFVEGNPSNL